MQSLESVTTHKAVDPLDPKGFQVIRFDIIFKHKNTVEPLFQGELRQLLMRLVTTLLWILMFLNDMKDNLVINHVTYAFPEEPATIFAGIEGNTEDSIYVKMNTTHY